MAYDTLIVDGKAVIPGQGVVASTIAIQAGRIAALLDPQDRPAAGEVISARGLYIFPGGIEPHTHIGWMGRSMDHYRTETRAAAVGGVTTIFNYLLSQGPLDDLYRQHRTEADPRVHVDYSFHFDGMGEAQLARLDHYRREYGASSFKYFTNVGDLDAERRGTAKADDAMLVDLMNAIARLPGTVLEVHVENQAICDEFEARAQKSDRNDQALYNEGRPPLAEGEAAWRSCYLAYKTGCPIHLAHISTADTLDAMRHFRARGARISAEVSHTHFTLTYDTAKQFTLKAPPIRGPEDKEAIVAGMLDGTIDCIAADHTAPGKIRAQRTNIWSAGHPHPVLPHWLPLLFSEIVHKRSMSLVRAAEISSTNAARIFHLYPRKGTILPGSDADLVLVDMEKEQTVDPSNMESDADFAIWEGWTLKGWPVRTLLRGRTVMVDGKIVGEPGWGQYLRRDPVPAS